MKNRVPKFCWRAMPVTLPKARGLAAAARGAATHRQRLPRGQHSHDRPRKFRFKILIQDEQSLQRAHPKKRPSAGAGSTGLIGTAPPQPCAQKVLVSLSVPIDGRVLAPFHQPTE